MESSGAGKLALLFPGQGAHDPRMLDGLLQNKAFDARYGAIVDALGYSPIEAIEKDSHKFNSHLLSSLFTILASSLSLDCFIETEGKKPDYFAGYSVGQFMALHAAGCFDFPYLIELTKTRSTILDQCAETTPGAMLGIVGVGLSAMESVVAELQQAGLEIFISNYNCLGQYSLAGSKAGVEAAMVRMTELKPKRLVELPVAGAWHSPLLAQAGRQFANYLKLCNWRQPAIPVIDNVTGDLLPFDVESMKEQLIKHVTAPVKWDVGVKTLVGLGCDRFVEIGYGNVLTKFGFFIDRNAEFTAYCGDERVEAKS